jgi:hypothetical protein
VRVSPLALADSVEFGVRPMSASAGAQRTRASVLFAHAAHQARKLGKLASFEQNQRLNPVSGGSSPSRIAYPARNAWLFSLVALLLLFAARIAK